MSIICTNYLTGNDSTGTGATSAPYKTIMKALGGATSGDEIRVAGGQWTAIGGGTGTFTFTSGSSAITTSANFTASLSAGDVITFDDEEFGFDKFHVKLSVVTGTQINMVSGQNWAGKTITVNTIYKMDAYHYNAVANPESFNNALYSPNGRTGIVVSGGWDSGYESNANGWTVFRNTTSGLFVATSSPGIGRWENNLVFDKFMMAAGFFINGISGSPLAVGTSFGLGKLALLPDGASRIVNGTSVSNHASVWNPPNGESELIVSGNVVFSGLINSPEYADAYGCVGLSPDAWRVNGWFSPSALSSSTTQAFLPYTTTFTSPASNIKWPNIHWRSSASNGNGSIVQCLNISSFPTDIENLTLYAGTNAVVYTMVGNNNSFSRYGVQLKNVGITGAKANQSGFVYGQQAAQTLIELESSTIESSRPSLRSGEGATALGYSFETTLAKIGETYLAPMQIKDTEGFKTMDLNNNVYYKDNTNNWLRVKPANFVASSGATGGVGIWSMLGVLEKPSTPFTVSITLKVSGGTWNSIGVQYGPLDSQIYTSNITPTTSFETYTINVNPAEIPDWNSFIYPLFIGINANMPNSFYEEPDIYCYVQSLTIE